MENNSASPPRWGLFAPLLSLVIYVIGHGLLTTLLTVRLNLSGTSSFLIGMVSTAYFGGLVTGTFINSRIIGRVGHIRSYAAYASILASIAILYGLIDFPESWIALRFFGGFATGGLLVVIESWMLVNSRPEIRGRIMALYMILFYSALAGGQLLLNVFPPESLEPLALVAMLASLSVVPLALSRVYSSRLETQSKLHIFALIRKVPAGTVSSFYAGMLLGVVYGLLPLFFAEIGYDLSQTANMMVVVILGGMACQYPLGKLSDHYDRRIILAVLFTTTAILSISFVLLSAATNIWLSAGLLFASGGMYFSLYPISLSHACDELSSEEIMEANQGLLLCYSVGAMTGPLIAPWFLIMWNSMGLFWYFSLICSVATLFLLWRLRRRDAVPAEEQMAFSISTPNTPVSVEFDPRFEATDQSMDTGFGPESDPDPAFDSNVAIPSAEKDSAGESSNVSTKTSE
jgi:MFS family permease